LAGGDPILYFDLGSPYSYLAIERAGSVLGGEPRLAPLLLGAVFARRGFGSWSATAARETRIAEIEARAERYGLPAIRWPREWPVNGLQAMRCATWAARQGAGAAFARAAFRAEFARGEDISDPGVLRECARAAGLDPQETIRASGLPEVKEALREATETAWRAGVRGVPALKVGEVVFYGEDQLELAAETLSGVKAGTRVARS
jgi:2-hydroxychromene-2-carboxylate isomerase